MCVICIDMSGQFRRSDFLPDDMVSDLAVGPGLRAGGLGAAAPGPLGFLDLDERGGVGPNGKPSLLPGDAGTQITRTNARWSTNIGEAATVSYAFRSTAPVAMPNGTSGFTQFTAAQAQWSNAQEAILYPSGSWIENEMKTQTKEGFAMKGVPDLGLSASDKLPATALHAEAGEAFIVPSKGKNAAGGKELMRAMLSKEAATNFAKTRLASTIVKGLVPADGFGSTALQAQVSMLDAAAKNVFSFRSIAYYGMNKDNLVVMNSFLDGKLDAAGALSALQAIVDKVAADSNVKKIEIK